jgi:hypothetical protein
LCQGSEFAFQYFLSALLTLREREGNDDANDCEEDCHREFKHLAVREFAYARQHLAYILEP